MLEDNSEPSKSLTEKSEDSLIQTEDITKITQGDLYVVGKLWIDVLKIGLLGTKRGFSLIPVVEAAPPPPPSRPPKMKYKDLPVYTAPHYEYKDYEEDKIKCPQLRRRMIHENIVPHIASCRRSLVKTNKEFWDEFNVMKKSAVCKLKSKKNDFINYMRDDKNLQTRQAVLALGGLTGFYYSSNKRQLLLPRIFFTSVGLLATGALCFPKDTDETFRSLSYTTAKALIAAYNKFCGMGFALRERIPCPEDVPKPLPPRKQNKCPIKKKK